MALLEIHDIHTYYGDAYILQGLSLNLEEGQILGLLGRNGVGKTTLVNSIIGFTPPRRGRILFKGTDITAASSFATVRAGMGLVPQGRRVFPTLTVAENLRVAGRSADRHGWTLGAGLRRCSLASPNDTTRGPSRYRAASSRCWRSGAV